MAGADDAIEVVGTLQVRSRTQPITVPVTVTAAVDDRLEVRAKVRINRRDFGLDRRIPTASAESDVMIQASFRRHRTEETR